LVDIVIVVSASKKVRIKRLMKSGFSRSDAVDRIRAQAKVSNYRRIADIVIENDRSLRDLRKKVKRIISKL